MKVPAVTEWVLLQLADRNDGRVAGLSLQVRGRSQHSRQKQNPAERQDKPHSV
jgi:hypothetical protein